MLGRTSFHAGIACFVLLLAVAIPVAATSLDILVIIPPRHSMSSEFFPLIEGLEEAGAHVDVASYQTGPYEFDGTYVAHSGADDTFEVVLTYDSIRVDDYDALILGPGHAHTMWYPSEGLDTVKALLEEAVHTHKLIGGVSYGAVHLIASGLIDGRSVCSAPHYRGIVSLVAHIERFLSTFDVSYVNECVYVDETSVPMVITAQRDLGGTGRQGRKG